MMVDEADIDLVGGSSSQSSGRGVKRPAESPNPSPLRPSKRKAGPLPRDLCIKRPFSPISSPLPPASPSSPSSPNPLPTGDVFASPPPSPSLNNCQPTVSTPPIAHGNLVIDIDEEPSSPAIVGNRLTEDPPSTEIVLNGSIEPPSTVDETCQPVTSNSFNTSYNIGPSVIQEPLISPSPPVTQFLNGDIKGKLGNRF